jgi:O-antigen ligase
LYNYASGVSYWVDEPRFAGLNNDPNELGLTLVLGLPMAWYLSLSQPQRRFTWAWQLYVPIGCAAILLTGSRGAFVAALVTLASMPWALSRLGLRTKAAVYALLVASIMLATGFVPKAILERMGSTRADMAAGYFGGRGAIWKAGLQLVHEHPIAGAGAGTFAAGVAPILGGHSRASHDAFLSILVEEGIVGLCLFLAIGATATKPLRHLPAPQRRFSIVLLAALAVGSLALTWNASKQLWFVLGLLAAQRALQPTWTAASRVMRRSPSSGAEPRLSHQSVAHRGV